MGFPLIHQGKLLGILAVEKSELHAYGALHASLALAFANQAVVTLSNVRLYEESLRRAFELDQRSELLNRTSASLSQAVEPRDVLVVALQALAEALGTSRGAAILFDEGGANTRARISARYPAGQDDANSLPLAANVLLDRLRSNLAPVVAADVAADSLIGPEYAAWIGTGVQSALFLPLTVAGRLIGLIGLGDENPRAPFTAGDLELAMTLTNQAAMAAHNARLYRQTQRRLTELAAITQTSRSISHAIDLKCVFDNVREQIEANLRTDNFYVALYDEANNQVSYPLAVENGERVELGTRAPDILISHIIETQQSLLLMGDTGSKLAQLGLLPAGSTEDEVLSVVRAKAYLGVPMVSGSNVLGVLAIEDFQRSFAFTDKHERGAAAIAAPLSAAIEGARLYEDSARRALALDSRAALLGRLSAQLGEATGLTAILQAIAQVTAQTLMADIGAALVLDDRPGALLPIASVRYPDDTNGGLPAFVVTGSPLLRQLQKAMAPITLDELSTEVTARAELTAWLGQDVGAALFLPLIAADKLTGLVAVAQVGRQRNFSSGEADLAMSLANQAAVAAANARLHEKVQPRLLELAAISRICKAISRATGLSQLCDIVVSEIGDALAARTIVMAVYDDASEALSFPLVLDDRLRLSVSPQAPAGLLAHVLQKRASLLLSAQVEAQLEQLGLTYQPWQAGGSVPMSYLAVPLVLGNQVIGALAVEDHEHSGHFTQSHEFILNTVAAPIAVAVENLRLLTERDVRGHELAARTAHLALLNRLGTALMGSLDAETILRRTLEELATIVPADHLAGLVFDPTSAEPRLASMARVPASAEPQAAPPSSEALKGVLQSLRPAGAPLVIADISAQANVAPDHTAWLAADARCHVRAINR